jgi:hypothetical protein
MELEFGQHAPNCPLAYTLRGCSHAILEQPSESPLLWWNECEGETR